MGNSQIFTKRYKAKRKGFIHAIIGGLVLFPFLLFLSNTDLVQKTPWVLLPFIAPLALVIWLYLDTFYQIEGEFLFYRSGFINGKIRISDIREIHNRRTVWTGIKPALSTGGIIIQYGKYDEIYLAPKSNSELIEDLLKINPQIIVSLA